MRQIITMQRLFGQCSSSGSGQNRTAQWSTKRSACLVYYFSSEKPTVAITVLAKEGGGQTMAV